MVKISGLFRQAKRVSIDILAAVIILGAYLTGFYNSLPNPLQIITFKAVLISMAVVHAHAAGKLLFGKVNWDEMSWEPRKILRISLYISFVIAYSMGG